MNTTTSTTMRPFEGLKLGDIERLVKEVESLPKNDQWILIGPSGQMYKGTIEQISHVTIGHHPLMQPYKYKPAFPTFK